MTLTDKITAAAAWILTIVCGVLFSVFIFEAIAAGDHYDNDRVGGGGPAAIELKPITFVITCNVCDEEWPSSRLVEIAGWLKGDFTICPACAVKALRANVGIDGGREKVVATTNIVPVSFEV